jgi:hypothetical protein
MVVALVKSRMSGYLFLGASRQGKREQVSEA